MDSHVPRLSCLIQQAKASDQIFKGICRANSMAEKDWTGYISPEQTEGSIGNDVGFLSPGFLSCHTSHTGVTWPMFHDRVLTRGEHRLLATFTGLTGRVAGSTRNPLVSANR